MKMWRGNLQDYVIPDDVDRATHWRKDGMPDERYKNAEFFAWLYQIAVKLPDGRVIP